MDYFTTGSRGRGLSDRSKLELEKRDNQECTALQVRHTTSLQITSEGPRGINHRLAYRVPNMPGNKRPVDLEIEAAFQEYRNRLQECFQNFWRSQ